MNYNQSRGSQTIPQSYLDRLNPEFVESVQKDEAKGDFISLISRGPADFEMVDRFEKYWKINNGKTQTIDNSTYGEESATFKFHKMELLDGNTGNGFEGKQFPSKEIMINNTNFLRSDHAAFWFSNHRDYYASLKAIHVSDTGKIYLSITYIYALKLLILGF